MSDSENLQMMIEKYKKEMMRYSLGNKAAERNQSPARPSAPQVVPPEPIAEPEPQVIPPEPIDRPEVIPPEMAPPEPMAQPEVAPPEPMSQPEQELMPPEIMNEPERDDPLDDTGLLQVRVATGNSAIPLTQATVVISRAVGDGEQLVRILKTDNDGRTETIELPTYNRIGSESPNDVTAKFTLYNIYIDYPGYYPSRSMGVPIFGGVTSTQTFELIPLSEFSSEDTVNTIENTEPQNL